MNRKRPLAAKFAIIIALFYPVILPGCGGGGGGPGRASQINGSVIGQPTRGNGISGATVNAYIWPDLTTVVATTVSDSTGHYVLTLPTGAEGKDVFVTGVKGTKGTSVRVSGMVADQAPGNISNLNLDPPSTLGAE